jgi:ectoine hydroxylase-related dioxygenase (phytanoyl-CoA dioxygenase family)
MPIKSIEPNKLDWLDHFQQHGYAVVKGAMPVERARAYQQQAFDWVKSFGTAFDVDKPETWTKENLPVQSQINTFAAYGVAHEKFMWDARMEPGVLAAFAELWGTDELLVSFDALNITFPNRKDKPRKEPWPHIDQSPLRKGLQCAQGVICLSDSGPEDGGLLVYPDSHLLTEEFFETQTDKATWKVKDGYGFTEEQVKWYTDRGIKTHKVCAEAGDLLIWDSRTIHWGTEPTEKGNTIRTVIYASYAPAALASAETLEKKAEVFRAWESTTHWAHDNIVFKKTEAKLDDGSIDPRSRDEPREKPELSDKLLRLAGAKAY